MANVLGKAVECICVLENREERLTRELEGLKALLRGLVSGTELLGEWEREWVGAFGGGERNEVGVEDRGNGNEDDTDEDEEGESDDEGEGRKRKKWSASSLRPCRRARRRSAGGRGRSCPSLRPPLHRRRRTPPTNSSHAGSPALALSTSVPMHSSTAAKTSPAPHGNTSSAHSRSSRSSPTPTSLRPLPLLPLNINMKAMCTGTGSRVAWEAWACCRRSASSRARRC
ncbi:hypothetical protein B0H16DRAFT_1609713, partial [Mycena metata]